VPEVGFGCSFPFAPAELSLEVGAPFGAPAGGVLRDAAAQALAVGDSVASSAKVVSVEKIGFTDRIAPWSVVVIPPFLQDACQSKGVV
jgi:hypothetical protein